MYAFACIKGKGIKCLKEGKSLESGSESPLGASLLKVEWKSIESCFFLRLLLQKGC